MMRNTIKPLIGAFALCAGVALSIEPSSARAIVIERPSESLVVDTTQLSFKFRTLAKVVDLSLYINHNSLLVIRCTPTPEAIPAHELTLKLVEIHDTAKDFNATKFMESSGYKNCK